MRPRPLSGSARRVAPPLLRPASPAAGAAGRHQAVAAEARVAVAGHASDGHASGERSNRPAVLPGGRAGRGGGGDAVERQGGGHCAIDRHMELVPASALALVVVAAVAGPLLLHQEAEHRGARAVPASPPCRRLGRAGRRCCRIGRRGVVPAGLHAAQQRRRVGGIVAVGGGVATVLRLRQGDQRAARRRPLLRADDGGGARVAQQQRGACGRCGGLCRRGWQRRADARGWAQ